jgi:hypothetical protein
MNTAATIARIAMWIMITAVVLSFFMRSRWITITWVSAAVVCVICMVIVAASKRR